MGDRAEWLEWRRGGIGASDVAAAFTGHYGGGYRVVADKLGIELPDGIDPALADRGHRWETAIADGVHALTGWYVHGEQLWVTSPIDDLYRATVDGLLDRNPTTTVDDAPAVLEVKTLTAHVPAKWDYFRAQTQWQMNVCQKRKALIAVATIGVDDEGDEAVTKLTLEWVERDDFLIEELEALADVLWSFVERELLPEPDHFTDIADVKAVNAEVEPAAEVDIDDLDEMLSDWQLNKDLAKLHEAEHRVLEAKIRHRMGMATEAYTSDGGWRVRVGQPVRRFTAESEKAALILNPECAKTSLDVELFRTLHPPQYEELKRDTTDRRLTVKRFDD